MRTVDVCKYFIFITLNGELFEKPEIAPQQHEQKYREDKQGREKPHRDAERRKDEERRTDGDAKRQGKRFYLQKRDWVFLKTFFICVLEKYLKKKLLKHLMYL